MAKKGIGAKRVPQADPTSKRIRAALAVAGLTSSVGATGLLPTATASASTQLVPRTAVFLPQAVFLTTGPQGPQGFQGRQGAQGSKGLQGSTGAQGNQGFQGRQGSQGRQGATGTNGVGTQGVQGASGVGYSNVTSTTSFTFADGTTGAQTFTVNGVGAFTVGERIRVANTASPSNFIEGTITNVSSLASQITLFIENTSGYAIGVTTWSIGLTGLVGPQGFQGAQGLQGVQGFQGDQGSQGFQGNQGFQGTQGLQGTQGFQGANGAFSAGYGGMTSTTSTTVSTGSKTFAVTTTGGYMVGDRVRVSNSANTASFMEGVITALTTNSSVTVNVDLIGTITTATTWNFGIAGAQGTQGFQGFQGFQGTQGVQGFQGAQGTQGFQGTQGLQGNQGTQGNQGAVQIFDSNTSGTGSQNWYMSPSSAAAGTTASITTDALMPKATTFSTMVMTASAAPATAAGQTATVTIEYGTTAALGSTMSVGSFAKNATSMTLSATWAQIPVGNYWAVHVASSNTSNLANVSYSWALSN